mmetsp:Transcript_53508/g.86555  ORF Transcript_53508/g.86555 Transcript_53508/m.86555 type:complete len:222 (-) Transcript_53508:58-723(-)
MRSKYERPASASCRNFILEPDAFLLGSDALHPSNVHQRPFVSAGLRPGQKVRAVGLDKFIMPIAHFDTCWIGDAPCTKRPQFNLVLLFEMSYKHILVHGQSSAITRSRQSRARDRLELAILDMLRQITILHHFCASGRIDTRHHHSFSRFLQHEAANVQRCGLTGRAVPELLGTPCAECVAVSALQDGWRHGVNHAHWTFQQTLNTLRRRFALFGTHNCSQ